MENKGTTWFWIYRTGIRGKIDSYGPTFQVTAKNEVEAIEKVREVMTHDEPLFLDQAVEIANTIITSMVRQPDKDLD